MKLVGNLLLFCLVYQSVSSQKLNSTNRDQVELVLNFQNQFMPKSLLVKYYNQPVASSPNIAINKEYAVTGNSDGSFLITLMPLEDFGYITVAAPSDILTEGEPILYMYLIERGDKISLHLQYDSSKMKSFQNEVRDKYGENLVPRILAEDQYLRGYNYSFSGKGAGKFKFRNEVDKNLNSPYGYYDLSLSQKSYDSLLRVFANVINYKTRQVLLANILGARARSLISNYFEVPESPVLKKYHEQGLAEIKKLQQDFHNYNLKPEYLTVAYLSPYYFLLNAVSIYSLAQPVKVYSSLKENYSGWKRDASIMNLLYHPIVLPKISDSLIQDASKVVATPLFKTVLKKEYSEFLRRGVQAYDFSLQDTSGKLVKLSDFKGKVVFIDFWFTGCLACTELYKNVIKPVRDSFSLSQAVFISVCTDVEKNQWLESLRSGRYSSENEINLFTGGQKHPVIAKYKVIENPRVILIDKQGKIITDKKEELGGRTVTSNGLSGFYPEKLMKLILQHL